MRPIGGKTKCGGYFNDELDAAKRMNELCENFGIPPKNPGMIAIDRQYQVKRKCPLSYGVVKNQNYETLFFQFLLNNYF